MAEDLSNMLMMALKKEKNSYNFYMRAQGMSRLGNVKDLFLELAKSEEEHKKAITDYIEELRSKGEEWNPAEDLGETDEVGFSKYLVKTKLSEDTSYQDALIIALKREERAYILFDYYYRIVKDEGAKNLFKRLMDDEMNHLKMIEKRYEEEIQTDN